VAHVRDELRLVLVRDFELVTLAGDQGRLPTGYGAQSDQCRF